MDQMKCFENIPAGLLKNNIPFFIEHFLNAGQKTTMAISVTSDNIIVIRSEQAHACLK